MKLNIVEPAVVPETYATELVLVEPIADGLFRLVFASKARPLMYEGRDEHCIVAKLIVSEGTLQDMRLALAAPGGKFPPMGEKPCAH